MPYPWGKMNSLDWHSVIWKVVMPEHFPEAIKSTAMWDQVYCVKGRDSRSPMHWCFEVQDYVHTKQELTKFVTSGEFINHQNLLGKCWLLNKWPYSYSEICTVGLLWIVLWWDLVFSFCMLDVVPKTFCLWTLILVRKCINFNILTSFSVRRSKFKASKKHLPTLPTSVAILQGLLWLLGALPHHNVFLYLNFMRRIHKHEVLGGFPLHYKRMTLIPLLEAFILMMNGSKGAGWWKRGHCWINSSVSWMLEWYLKSMPEFSVYLFGVKSKGKPNGQIFGSVDLVMWVPIRVHALLLDPQFQAKPSVMWRTQGQDWCMQLGLLQQSTIQN